MSDTPRTDRMFEAKHASNSVWDFARQLERELNALRESLTLTEIGLSNRENECDGFELMLKHAKAELTALRSSQMDEAKAREVLDDWIDEDGELLIIEATTASGGKWFLDDCVPYSPDQLRAIAWWMDNKGGEK